MSPTVKTVAIGLPLGLLMLTAGLAVALTGAERGHLPMGLVIALMGAAFLLAAVAVLLPRRPVEPRTEGDVVVVDGSPWPWRLLALLTVGTTAAAVLATIGLTYPEVLAQSSGRRSPVVLLGLWPLGAWMWFVLVRGRTRQRIEVRGDVVTLHAGRQVTQVRATRKRVQVGTGPPARAQSVIVRAPARQGELVLASGLFATTPESLAGAIRAALPR